jgi:hypothetical protein
MADAVQQNVDLAGMTGKEKLAMVAATPKAAMATADLSAPLRQGGVLGSRFLKNGVKLLLNLLLTSRVRPTMTRP